MKGLRHRSHFPHFRDLPDYDSPFDSIYFTEYGDGGGITRSMHYCFLGNILEASVLVGRPRVKVQTASNEELIIHFYHDQRNNPTTFKWSDLKYGACLAVLYPYRKYFMDMTDGVRVEELDSVFIFQSPLEILLKTSDKLLNKPQLCFEDSCILSQRTICNETTDLHGSQHLLRCADCKLAKYCCKEHQKADWFHHRRCAVNYQRSSS